MNYVETNEHETDSVSDSILSEEISSEIASSVTDETSSDILSSYTEPDYTAEIVQNQRDILEQSKANTYLLSGILITVFTVLGVIMAVLIGRWVYSLVRC